ncbi:MAG: M48 family metalloprotease [Candidatus Bathyarchaeota archaeon]|nr:MAG: M48 family metalloprotease [Candidatus Bathyarchaeota archaeon]
MVSSSKTGDVSKTRYVFSIDTELTLGNVRFLPEYLRRRYLLQHDKYRAFWDIHVITNDVDGDSLSYKVASPYRNQFVDVRVEAQVPIRVEFILSDAMISKSYVDDLYEDLFLMVQLFEEEVRETTLSLAFMPGETFSDRKEDSGMLIRFFADSMLPLFIILTALTFGIFWIFGGYAPLIYVVVSGILALISGKLLAQTGKWNITLQHPEIHLLQYHLTPHQFEAFREQYGSRLSTIRKAFYNATIAAHQPITCETAGSIFTEYGIACDPKDFTVKHVNLYDLVSTAASKFGMAMPAIVVVDSIIPNAAAAGPNVNYGTIVVTTGLLAQLEDDELVSIFGHELSHLAHHDPLLMSAVSSMEYLLRFYVFWPYLFFLGIGSYWLYSLVSLSSIYLIGKIIEGRADLEAAKMLRHPQALAEALKKIAFRRLFPLSKREPAFRGYRRLEWFQLDPHPPAYFRIARLEQLDDPDQLANTLVQSIRDSVNGFLRG